MRSLIGLLILFTAPTVARAQRTTRSDGEILAQAEAAFERGVAAKDRFLAEKTGEHKNEFVRLKGLGEMDYDELGETTMDMSKRTLLKVTAEQAAQADEVFSVLMGDDVPARKNFIVTNAKDVRFLDI